MKNKKNNYHLLIYDILFISLALLLSWLIRSRFSFFNYKIDNFLLTLPYVIISRIITCSVFEEYTFTYNKIYISDIKRLVKINLIPSGLFLLIRLFLPLNAIRLPFTMIATEYVLATTGMVIVRIIYSNIRQKNKINENKSVIILSNNINTIKTSSHKGLSEQYSIYGIITRDKLDWGSDTVGLRVLGGVGQISEILSEQDIFALILLDDSFTYEERMSLVDVCVKYSVLLLKEENGNYRQLYLDEIYKKYDRKQVQKITEDRKIIVIGYEKRMKEYIDENYYGQILMSDDYDFTGGREASLLVDFRPVMVRKYFFSQENYFACIAALNARLGFAANLLTIIPGAGFAEKEALGIIAGLKGRILIFDGIMIEDLFCWNAMGNALVHPLELLDILAQIVNQLEELSGKIFLYHPDGTVGSAQVDKVLKIYFTPHSGYAESFKPSGEGANQKTVIFGLETIR